MADYCSESDLLKVKTAAELAQLSDLDADQTADVAVVAAACADATALIDSYVSPRYALPLASVPAVLKALAVRVSLYYLYLWRGSVTEDVRKQQEADVKWLEQVRAGARLLSRLGRRPLPGHRPRLRRPPIHAGQDGRILTMLTTKDGENGKEASSVNRGGPFFSFFPSFVVKVAAVAVASSVRSSRSSRPLW